MPFITFDDIVPKSPTSENKPDVGAGVEKQEHPKPQTIDTPQQQLILKFKQFLKKNDLYNGDVSVPNTDAQFIAGLIKLENLLSQGLEHITGATNSAKGLIWQGNQINPQTSPEDVEAALKLIAQSANMKKEGQANLDTLDPSEETPTAVKFNKIPDETQLESGDPLDSQQIGKSKQELPNMLEQIDKRIAQLTNFCKICA